MYRWISAKTEAPIHVYWNITLMYQLYHRVKGTKGYCISVWMYRWISAKTEAPIHLYIGTLQSSISYGFVKYWFANDVVLTIGNTKGYCISV